MKLTHGNWQKAIWNLLTNPAIEIAVTIALVMVAAWYLVQTDGVDPRAGLPPFGRR